MKKKTNLKKKSLKIHHKIILTVVFVVMVVTLSLLGSHFAQISSSSGNTSGYTPNLTVTAIDLNAGTFTIDPASQPSNVGYACQFTHLTNVNTLKTYELHITNCADAQTQATTTFSPTSVPDGTYMLSFDGGNVAGNFMVLNTSAFTITNDLFTGAATMPTTPFNLTALNTNSGTFTIDPSSIPSTLGYACQTVQLQNVKVHLYYGIHVTNCQDAVLQATTSFTPESFPDGTYVLVLNQGPVILVSQTFILTGGILSQGNNPPVINSMIVSSNPVQLNTPVNMNATFSDPDTTDTHTATIIWGDGQSSSCPPDTASCSLTETNGSGTITGEHTYNALGSYTVKLTVTDNSGASDSGQTVVAVIPAGGLTGSNLKGSNYTGANLSNQNISNSNLKNATFDTVNFTNANLSGINALGDSFIGANFTNADLTNANLKTANVTNANMTGANLTGVNFMGATITGIIWSNTICPNGTNSSADGGTCIGQGGGL